MSSARPAARMTDLHSCAATLATPAGAAPVLAGNPTVRIGGMPAAALGDPCACIPTPDPITGGSATVLIGGRPAARLGDPTAHGGALITGCFSVLIGG